VIQDYCRGKLGQLDSRIQMRSYEEIKAHNAAGQCWLILDGARHRAQRKNCSGFSACFHAVMTD
jgi:hypothetical protein